jgi:hypothetical protein
MYVCMYVCMTVRYVCMYYIYSYIRVNFNASFKIFTDRVNELIFLGYDASSLGEPSSTFRMILFPTSSRVRISDKSLNVKELRSFETSGTSHLVTQHHIPEEHISPAF